MHIRRATSADYDDVMSIGRFNEGRDYMPGLYTALSESANTQIFVGYIEDQCVRLALQNDEATMNI